MYPKCTWMFNQKSRAIWEAETGTLARHQICIAWYVVASITGLLSRQKRAPFFQPHLPLISSLSCVLLSASFLPLFLPIVWGWQVGNALSCSILSFAAASVFSSLSLSLSLSRASLSLSLLAVYTRNYYARLMIWRDILSPSLLAPVFVFERFKNVRPSSFSASEVARHILAYYDRLLEAWSRSNVWRFLCSTSSFLFLQR